MLDIKHLKHAQYCEDIDFAKGHIKIAEMLQLKKITSFENYKKQCSLLGVWSFDKTATEVFIERPNPMDYDHDSLEDSCNYEYDSCKGNWAALDFHNDCGAR
jgi:hypothetical protein